MLEVKGVSKTFDNRRGVQGIDFSMQRGEIVGFLGPNGAGKTTTMRMITGYLNPTAGSILVDGKLMSEHPKAARRKIGYLPETPPLYPEMTVLSYLKFIANLRDIPAREQKSRISEVIGKLGLSGRERQVIRGLSKGYKQRLGLAQAILHKPELLVLDEPTSGLDPKQIIEIRELIRELGENHTVLLSTHILPEVNAICNRVLIINQGRIVLDEHPENLGRSMGERFEIALEVKGPQREVIELLQNTASVTEVQLVGGGERLDSDASLKLRLKSDQGVDFREALFFQLANAGYPILELKRESLSLEDIFLKLTTDEPAARSHSETEDESDLPTETKEVSGDE